MAEIRSTLDIIMERTRGMALSQEEKDQLRQDEFAKRAKGLQMRLLEDPANADVVLSSLGAMGDQDRTLLETLVWKTLVQDLPADRQGLKYVPVLRRLAPAKKKAPVLDGIEADFKAIAKAQGSEEKRLVAREKKKLASFGISGTAVIPKISDSDAVGLESQRIMGDLKKRLLEGV